MKKVPVLVLALLVFFLPTVQAQVAPGAKRVALVIGQSKYQFVSPLSNPANDADDIAEKLKGLGFEVILRKDVRLKSTLIRIIEEFGDRIPTDGVALLFYAGHGAQADGNNYLIPTGANTSSEAQLKDQGVGLDVIMGAMSNPDKHMNIIIIDACRNSLRKRVRELPEGLAAIVGPRGTYVAYATAPGSVAAELPSQRNGLFTKHLLNRVGTPGMKIEDIFKFIRQDVTNDRANEVGQMPWDASSLLSDFYFNPVAASLVIVSNKPGLDVYLNEKMIGTTSMRGQRFRVSNIETGRPQLVTGKIAGSVDVVKRLTVGIAEEAVVELGESTQPTQPTLISITEIPPYDPKGGREGWTDIAGEISIDSPQDYNVVLYSWTDKWYVQPVVGREFTQVRADGKWSARIHRGTNYAALLVKRTFIPPPITYNLPEEGGDVIAVTSVEGTK